MFNLLCHTDPSYQHQNDEKLNKNTIHKVWPYSTNITVSTINKVWPKSSVKHTEMMQDYQQQKQQSSGGVTQKMFAHPQVVSLTNVSSTIHQSSNSNKKSTSFFPINMHDFVL